MPETPARSDAARNRKHLLDVATRVFQSAQGEPSLREIAREAGVGIATLYRHFPTREALVAAVYADQVARLTDGAQQLLATHPPAEALRRWMDLFGDWIATKDGMLNTLLALIESDEIPHARTHTDLITAIEGMLKAGQASGELRTDITAQDIAAHLIGIFTVAPVPQHSARAERLLNVLLHGLRPAHDAG
ncbi:TetR/AcrR family transcriptional regulator [Kineosporia babensis]|uniref:TetR/AcrR family transcriptional regulator n=1 Tax=Kineosporia babensis TaxID=499548 RepID=A0A9X1NCI6_9ACTN|nr:TetR/AcrR family transcriptional regulator [Kineosporia babensis]MCD5310533.1 TetR/AcrR family transcriptional regulator [Kineosporia babensis]